VKEANPLKMALLQKVSLHLVPQTDQNSRGWKILGGRVRPWVKNLRMGGCRLPAIRCLHPCARPIS